MESLQSSLRKGKSVRKAVSEDGGEIIPTESAGSVFETVMTNSNASLVLHPEKGFIQSSKNFMNKLSLMDLKEFLRECVEAHKSIGYKNSLLDKDILFSKV